MISKTSVYLKGKSIPHPRNLGCRLSTVKYVCYRWLLIVAVHTLTPEEIYSGGLEVTGRGIYIMYSGGAKFGHTSHI